MFKIKGIKLVLICLLVTLSASCFSLLFVNAMSNISTRNKEEVAAWSGSGTSSSPYLISSKSDLQTLATNVSNGTSYSGKYFKLKTSINCGGSNIQIGKNYEEIEWINEGGYSFSVTKNYYNSFAGTFDGNGFTISNVNITALNAFTDNVFNTEGLFVSNSGTIKNLKVSNFSMHIGYGGTATRAGALVGRNSGTIQGCIVENVKFISNRLQSQCTVGAIVGVNEGTIKNSIVLGDYAVGGYNSGNGIKSNYFVAEGNQAQRCVFDAKVYKTEKTQYVILPVENDSSALGDNYLNYKGFGSSGSDSDTLIDSFFSGYYTPDQTIWHIYKDGYSYSYEGKTYWIWLKAFINMKKISFSAVNGSIYPSGDYECPQECYSSVEEYNCVTIYGQKFVASSNDSAKYEFSEWIEVEKEGSTGYTWTAIFEEIGQEEPEEPEPDPTPEEVCWTLNFMANAYADESLGLGPYYINKSNNVLNVNYKEDACSFTFTENGKATTTTFKYTAVGGYVSKYYINDTEYTDFTSTRITKDTTIKIAVTVINLDLVWTIKFDGFTDTEPSVKIKVDTEEDVEDIVTKAAKFNSQGQIYYSFPASRTMKGEEYSLYYKEPETGESYEHYHEMQEEDKIIIVKPRSVISVYSYSIEPPTLGQCNTYGYEIKAYVNNTLHYDTSNPLHSIISLLIKSKTSYKELDYKQEMGEDGKMYLIYNITSSGVNDIPAGAKVEIFFSVNANWKLEPDYYHYSVTTKGITPKIVENTKTLSFNNATMNGQDVSTNDSVASYKVSMNTPITTSMTSITIEYSFKDFESNNILVTFNITNELYIFSSTGWENNAPITEDTTITPTVSQKYIYVQFNNATIGTHTVIPTGTVTKIDLNSLSAPTGLNTNVLTFSPTLDGVTKTVKYTTIENVYIFTAAGIDQIDAEHIQVTPVFEAIYKTLIFKQTETINTRYSNPKLNGTDITNQEIYVPINVIITPKDLNTNTITYTFKDIFGTTNNVIYTIHELYIFTDAGIGEEIDRKIQITPVVSQAYIYVQFNNATIGSHTVTPTGAVTKIDLNSLSAPTGLNTNVLTFNPTLDGLTKTVKYTTIENVYIFTAAGIDKIDAEHIQVTPELNSTLKQVTFAEIEKATGESTGTYTVKNNTKIIVNLNAAKNELIFTFKAFNEITKEDETKTVKYTSDALYIFSSAGWENNAPITEDITITPTVSQKYIYIQFNNATTDTHTATLTGAIAGTAIKVDINTLVEPTGLNTNVLTFSPTLDGATKTVTYTTIANAYEFTASGITTVDAENISVTPVLGSVLRQVTFANIDKATKEATDTYTVKNNTTISVSLNAANNVLTFTFNAFNTTTNADESETVTYTSHELYTFSSAGWEDGAAVTTDTTITPTVSQKYIYVQFNDATIGTHTVTPTGAVTKIDLNSLSAPTGLNTNVLTFSPTLDGVIKTVTYTTIENAYMFTAAGINPIDAEHIQVTPELNSTLKQVTFAEIEKATGESTGTYTVKNNTKIIVNLNAAKNELIFTFKAFNEITKEDETKTVKYTSDALYIFSSAGWENNAPITEDITITPTVSQKYIYIQFNNATIGSHTVIPTGVVTKIDLNSLSAPTGLNTNVLTFSPTLDGVTKTVTYTTIANAYEFTASGITTVDAENISVTPVLGSVLRQVTFANIDKATGVATGTYTVKNNTTISVNLNAAKNVLTFTFNAFNTTTNADESETVTYTSHELYTFSSAGWEDGAAVTTDTTITPTVSQKYIYVQFNDATIGTHTVTPTGAVTKIDLNSLSAPTGLNTNVLTFSPTLDGVIKTVTYTTIENAYMFTAAGINPIDAEHIQVTPVFETIYKTLVFKQTETINTRYANPKLNGTDITNQEIHVPINVIITPKDLNTNTITYTFKDIFGTTNNVIYIIHELYIFTDAGIGEEVDGKIEIKPELEQAYVLVTFGKTTGQAEISPDEETQLKVRYNSGNYISDGTINWTNCTLSYVVILANGSSKTITYTINPREKYTFDTNNRTPNEPADAEEVTISPTLILKMYDVGFGEA